MKMKFASNPIFGEYFAERNAIDLTKLHQKADFYNIGIRACNDFFVNIKGKGIILVKRTRKPCLGEYWCLGGGMYRGFPFEESLEKTLEREIGLKPASDPVFLGIARVFSEYDRDNKGTGMDAVTWVFYIECDGEITTDSDHQEPVFITRQTDTGFINTLHPFIRDFLLKALAQIP